MPSIENSLKHEEETPTGKVRLVQSGEFVRAYNRSAWRFYCCTAEYKVTRKFVKARAVFRRNRIQSIANACNRQQYKRGA